jgi:hypothetical protein
MAIGRVLVIVGLLMAAAGALLWWGVPVGRLPGDIVIRRGAFTFYAPITTAVLASLVITVVLALLKR